MKTNRYYMTSRTFIHITPRVCEHTSYTLPNGVLGSDRRNRKFFFQFLIWATPKLCSKL